VNFDNYKAIFQQNQRFMIFNLKKIGLLSLFELFLLRITVGSLVLHRAFSSLVTGHWSGVEEEGEEQQGEVEEEA